MGGFPAILSLLFDGFSYLFFLWRIVHECA